MDSHTTRWLVQKVIRELLVRLVHKVQSVHKAHPAQLALPEPLELPARLDQQVQQVQSDQPATPEHRGQQASLVRLVPLV